ncbi:MAG: ATP-binding protein [Phycisphaera sp.]|nr:MAG: ATP-binding protein [Phycisphaera sp.]
MSRPSQGLQPLLGRHADALDYAWLTGDSHERREIEITAELMRRQTGGGVLLDPPSYDQAAEPVSLGQIRHGNRQLGSYGLTHEQLMRHTGVFGSSGSGKSNLVLHALTQLVEQGIPWLLFDYKRSARALLSREHTNPIHVLTTARGLACSLRFNLLSTPPGIPPEDHDRQLAELISAGWTGGDATVSALGSAITSTRRRLHPLTPTLREVRDDCRKTVHTGRAKGWKQTLMRILDDLVDGPLGRVFAHTRESDHLDLLLDHNTVVELDGLSTSDGAFLTSIVVRHTVQHIMHGRPREKLRLVVAVEEAHRLLSHTGRESVLEQSLRESREFGLGFIVVDQTPSQMSHTALANLHTFIAMRLNQQADVQTASRSLLLREDQKQILHSLGVGQAVARSGHWHSAVQVDVPLAEIAKGSVTDTDLEHAFIAGPYAPADDSRSPHETCSARSACGTPARTVRDGIPGVPRAEEGVSPARSLSDMATPDPLPSHPDAESLLKDVITQPLSSVTERYGRLGLSRRRGDGAKKLLLQAGYIRGIELRTPEGVRLLLETTELGQRWADRHRVVRPPINGSLTHEYWCDRIAKRLASHGWAVTRERTVGTGRIDVCAVKDGVTLAVEVETGKSSWAENLTRLAVFPAQHRSVLWLDQATQGRVKAIADDGVDVLLPGQVDSWLASRSTNNSNGGEKTETIRAPI